MRLATIRTAAGTRAVRLETDIAVETGDADLGALLRRGDWRERAAAAAGPSHPVDGLDYAPLVPAPEKIICIGLNYRDHIEETGRQPPEYPTLFAKFPSTLVGAYDDVLLPAVSDAVDWEAELAVIVGAPARHVTTAEAARVIAGYSVLNDVSVRDYQYRTMQWLQGKMFEATTPLGPALVTPDELGATGTGISAGISTEVDGEVLQRSDTGQLVFDPGALVAYLSEIITLRPGDVIATGTPGGVGHARKPPRYLTDGALLTTRIDGIGECRNRCRKEKAPA
jgi:acylpyruvate hydrolase